MKQFKNLFILLAAIFIIYCYTTVTYWFFSWIFKTLILGFGGKVTAVSAVNTILNVLRWITFTIHSLVAVATYIGRTQNQNESSEMMKTAFSTAEALKVKTGYEK